jgi:hypothetical protein
MAFNLDNYETVEVRLEKFIAGFSRTLEYYRTGEFCE